MDKTQLLQSMVEQLEQDHKALLAATQATYDAATHEENKPENEYDTRGLEASYLAGAQSKRVSEIEEALVVCKQIKLRNFNSSDPIAPTALVELESDGKITYVFLMPKGGGIHLNQQGRSIQVITGTSPLGEALLGLKVGDVAVVETPQQDKEYEILRIW
jgi:transcription elongation GreA/GreB family factor